MITIKGKSLSKSDKKILRQFSKFCLNKFIRPHRLKSTTISIRIVDPTTLKGKDKRDLSEYKAFMRNEKPNHFRILIDIDQIRRSAKSPRKRLGQVLLCLGHELVHVKQYVNHEMYDYANGDARWHGKRYTNWEDEDVYYFMPWEIQAYGLEQGLYARFFEEVNV